MNNHRGVPESRKRRRCEDSESQDFEQLAERYPEFRREWEAVKTQQREIGGSFSSFVTPEFNISLTRAIMHSKFGVDMPDLPLDRLTPPIPNRLAYVEWIQNELMPLLHQDNDYFVSTKPLQYCGLDIGVGASCIYPILFTCNNNDEWSMVGTEIDAVSLASARANVQANEKISSRIELHHVQPTRAQQEQCGHDSCESNDDSGGPIARAFECLDDKTTTFDFCMTNPPFFDSTKQLEPRADSRDRTPMTEYEGSYPGGEVGFVCDMIRDSFEFRDRIGWYSTMCGKKTSFQRLKQILLSLLGPGHVQNTEISKGNMTRWLLAWTFRQPKIASPTAKVQKTLNFDVDAVDNSDTMDPLDEVVSRIETYCETLPGWNLVTSVTPIENGKLVRIVESPTALVELDTGSSQINDTNKLPGRLLEAVDRGDWNIKPFLSEEGHFLAEALVTKTSRQQGNAESTTSTISVTLECYEHSNRGQQALSKIRSQLQGEICRTNRRWRRLRKRQAVEQAHGAGGNS